MARVPLGRWTGLILLVVTAVGQSACGDDGPGHDPDAARPDAAASDARPPDAAAPDAGPVDAAALPPGITALAAYEPVEPWEDLAALQPLVGDAEVVGLGESVHTSGGFYGSKARVIRYLVAELGFRVVAVETPWIEADRVGAYVATSVGDATDVLDSIFGVFADRHMRELVEWLAAWNRSHPEDPVAYLGFDIQQPWDDSRELRSFLEAAAPVDASTVHGPLLRCNGAPYASDDDYYGSGAYEDPIVAEDHAACLDALAGARTYLETRDATLTAASSTGAVALAHLHLRGLEAWEGEVWGLQEGDYPGGFESRDHGMADALESLLNLRHPGQQVALWAHNLHVAERHDEIVGSYNYGGTARSLGTFLRERRGDGYRALGILAYDTSINWPGIQVGPLPLPTGVDAVEVLLHGLGRPFLLVDLAFGGAADPFLTPGTLYRMHSGSPEYPDRLEPARQFHGLIYLDVSPGMEAVFW